MTGIGKPNWLIPDCELPPPGEGVLRGHESVIIVNDNDFDVNIQGTTALEDVSLPVNVTVIGNDCFKSCKELVSVTLPDGVTSIGKNAFYGCTLPRETFMNCKDLTTVTIENGVQSIGENVFNGCTNLTTIIIPDSVTTINNQAFGGRDEGSPCVVFYNGTAEGPGNWGDVIVVNSENLGGVPACTLNGDASTMNITLPEEVSADQLLIQIGQNTADGFVSDSTRTVEKKADDTFDISVTDITKKLIVLSPMETYNTYDNPLAGGEDEILVEDVFSINFGESGLVVYDSMENQYSAMIWETLIEIESEGFSETFYSGVKNTNGAGISLQAPRYDFFRVAYSGQSADEVTVTAEVGTPYESPVYAVLSFAKFSEDKTTFALEHIAFETTVVIGDGRMRNITFTLPAGYLTRLQTEVAFFSIAGTVSGE